MPVAADGVHIEYATLSSTGMALRLGVCSSYATLGRVESLLRDLAEMEDEKLRVHVSLILYVSVYSRVFGIVYTIFIYSAECIVAVIIIVTH